MCLVRGDHWITETWEDNSLVPRLEEEEEHTTQSLLPKQNVKSNYGEEKDEANCTLSKHTARLLLNIKRSTYSTLDLQIEHIGNIFTKRCWREDEALSKDENGGSLQAK
ncbi:hypothetical protein LguiB_018309 [Lonicera macranthoides]